MATAKQTTIRFGPEDLVILDAIQDRTGLFSRSDALRYALRYYAKAEAIEVAKPKLKPKTRK
jgi:Arc/MetJ-type ribon-helix-helix transcriptional regulator